MDTHAAGTTPDVFLGSDDLPGRDETLALYAAVGWTTYTDHPETLMTALAGSSLVVSARVAGQLVGLARTLSDGATICYLQDVLVHPEHQRHGIGSRLVEEVLRQHGHVRQTVLLTDDDEGQRAFYEALGFAETRDHGDGSLRAFVRVV